MATPLERQFSTIAGLDSMNSTSGLGYSSITLQFSLDRPLDAAAQDVQSAITAAQRQLPPSMPSPPTFQKVNPADQPILYISINSPTLPLSKVDEYAETLISQRISMVSGVAQVAVFGAQKYAVRVQLDPNALASRGIGIDEVQQALSSSTTSTCPPAPCGARTRPSPLQATGQLMTAAGLSPLDRGLAQRRAGAPAGPGPK